MREAVETAGFCLLSKHAPDEDTQSVAETLGTISHVPGLNTVQALVPRDLDSSPPNIYSGNYGVSAFPMHTDLAHWHLPPRYMVLRCVRGSAEVATHLLDSRPLVEMLGEDALTRTLVAPRRRVDGRRALLRLYEPHPQGTSTFRWDELFLVPSTQNSAAMLAAVGSSIASSSRREVYLTDPGDTLVVDNWRMLHGRAAVPVVARGRHIDRIYLSSLTPQ